MKYGTITRQPGESVARQSGTWGWDGHDPGAFAGADPRATGLDWTGTPGDDVQDGTSADDILRGLGGNDTLSGLDGDDSLYGGPGNDTLSGGAGDDLLQGDDGDDSLDGGEGMDAASYDGDGADAGTMGIWVDLSTGTATDTFGASDTLTSIEAVIGSAYADWIAGDDGLNVLIGGEGNDSLSGGQGDDFLFGGAGDDHLDGGDGYDYALYDLSSDGLGTAGVVANLGAGTATDTFGGTDTLSGIEAIVGSRFDDSLTGDAQSNDLVGYRGNDRLYGGEGDDWLSGGQGNDRLDGGAGFDYAYYDSEHLSGGSRGISARLDKGVVTDTFGTKDTLSGIEAVIGSAFKDTIVGDSNANYLVGMGGKDEISGGKGRDQLVGGAGKDILDGGKGFDVAAYHFGGTQGVRADLAKGTATDTFGSTDKLVAIEGVIGSPFRDVLKGSKGSDYLFGYDGNDSLKGGSGRDVLSGGDGNDRIDGGDDSDNLYGGAGSDVFVFKNSRGKDIVRDFDALDPLEKIDLRGVSAITSYSDLVHNHLTGSSYAVHIDDGHGLKITLSDVDIADLDPSDFLF